MKSSYLFLTLLLTTVVPLDAMKRQRPNKSSDKTQKSKKAKAEPGFQLKPADYPWSNNPSLQDQICFWTACNMHDEHDTQAFEELPTHLTQRILKMYHIHNKTSHVLFHDAIEYGLVSPEIVSQEFATQAIAFYLDNIFDGSIQAADLQSNLDVLLLHSVLIACSIRAHQQIFDYCIALSQEEIEERFNFLNEQSIGESTLKIALRLAYAKKYQNNLDTLDCVDFIDNIKWYGVNQTQQRVKTEQFWHNNIHHTLPFLELLIGKPVIILNLWKKEIIQNPYTLGNLINLEELWICNKNLTSLNNAIGNLVKLKVLHLGFNKLTKLPDTIGNLVNLEELDLRYNKLTDVPNEIGNLVNLKKLDLYENPLSQEVQAKIRRLVPKNCKISFPL